MVATRRGMTLIHDGKQRNKQTIKVNPKRVLTFAGQWNSSETCHEVLFDPTGSNWK